MSSKDDKNDTISQSTALTAAVRMAVSAGECGWGVVHWGRRVVAPGRDSIS